MLYLHCGWPKTGTKSLQAVLARNQDRLATAGIVYAERWRHWWGKPDHSHDGLVELLSGRQGPGRALDEFVGWLVAHEDQDVLLSFEAFTTRLPLLDREEAFLSFLDRARQVMPVSCVWTLRRFDDFRCSLYLQLISMGFAVPTVEEYIGQCRGGCLFRGMKQIEGLVDQVAYVKYDADGGHNSRILHALSLPEEVVVEIDRSLATAPLLNRSLSHKRAVAMLNLKAVVDRLEAPLDLGRAWQALNDGALDFDDDSRCELVGADARRELRRWALESAAKYEFAPYDRFYGEDDPGEAFPAQVGMDPAIVSDEDLHRLAALQAGLTRSPRVESREAGAGNPA